MGQGACYPYSKETPEAAPAPQDTVVAVSVLLFLTVAPGYRIGLLMSLEPELRSQLCNTSYYILDAVIEFYL